MKSDDSGAVGVFSYLTGQLIKEACDHAIAHGDFHLALLISRAIGSEDIRHLMLKQLATWFDTQVLIATTASNLTTICPEQPDSASTIKHALPIFMCIIQGALTCLRVRAQFYELLEAWLK